MSHCWRDSSVSKLGTSLSSRTSQMPHGGGGSQIHSAITLAKPFLFLGETGQYLRFLKKPQPNRKATAKICNQLKIPSKPRMCQTQHVGMSSSCLPKQLGQPRVTSAAFWEQEWICCSWGWVAGSIGKGQFQHGALTGAPWGGIATSSFEFFGWAGRNTGFWDDELVKMGKKLCLVGNDPSFLLGFSSTRKWGWRGDSKTRFLPSTRQFYSEASPLNL